MSSKLNTMKRKVQMSLDEEQVKELDRTLDELGLPRSTFVNMLLEDVNFALDNIQDNPGYFIVERILTRFYSLGLIGYEELTKVLGPERASEVSGIIRTVRTYRKWKERS